MPLHHRTYYEARGRFAPIQSQFVVRAIGVVADAYRRDRRALAPLPARRRRGLRRPAAALRAQGRLPAGIADHLGRGAIVCPLAIGGYQRAVLARATRVGECDLLRDRKGRWRLHLAVTLPDPMPADQSAGVLGVDVGIVNLAVD